MNKTQGLVQLPINILNSVILSNEDKALLCDVEVHPTINPAFEDEQLKNIFQYYSLTPEEMDVEVQKYASRLLAIGKVDDAWQVLLLND